MLHVLQPIWLLAASGIIIPIAIHLWNIKQGKTLKVGSIALLTRTSQEYASSLRLTELFLLLLRCLLILLLALLLAQPYWVNNGSGKGWVMMEKKDAQQAYTQFKPLTDSLLQAGYEFHIFEEGFEKKDIQSVLKENKDTTQKDQVSYWNLVKQLDRKLPQGFPVYLFTDNRLIHFEGPKPETSVDVKWQTFTNKDSTAAFVSKAYMSSSDSVMIVMGASDPSVTMYRQQSIAVNKPKQNDLVLDVINGNLAVRYKDDTPVLVDTATWNITIFSDTYPNDARYIRSALQSIQQVSKRKMKLSVTNRITGITAKQDWLFWLSDQPLPRDLDTYNVLMYEKGEPVSRHSWLRNDNGVSVKLPLYKRVTYHRDNTAHIWFDGFGDPILTKETSNNRNLFRLYSHFDPSWSDLAWNASFPQLIYGLIDPFVLKENINPNDKRSIAETHIQLNAVTKKTAGIQDIDTTNAKQILWLIIFVLFFVERFFSFRPKKEKANA